MNQKQAYTELRIMHAAMVLGDEKFPQEVVKHVHKAWKILLDGGKFDEKRTRAKQAK